MEGFPKDVVWLVLRFELRRVWCEGYPVRSYYRSLEYSGGFSCIDGPCWKEPMARRLIELSLVCKVWSTVLRSKCQWWTSSYHGGCLFKFRQGAFADMRSDEPTMSSQRWLL